MTALAIRTLDLPWTLDPVAERRFRRILRNTTLATLALALLMPWLPLPERDVTTPPEVPERYARLMLERAPPPPPVVAQAEPEPEPTRELAEPKPENMTVPQPRTAEVPAPQPSARERAATAGVMAFADTLADLRSNEAVAAATAADGLSAGAGETRHNERSVITAAGGRASGGINTASMSRNTGGSGVGGREVTQVASALPGGGGGGAAGGRGDGSGANSRSREEIELVFDRNKSAIYALYNRALRSDPMLRGRLVLELTIAPSGEVTGCRVVSSELADPEFERRLVARVMLFRFEDKDVATMTTTKPIEFFPA
jgi:periplasmic protein TonB